MQKVSELVSKNIGDTLTNIRTWKNVMYNVLENGLVGDGTTDDTAALQTLINTAIAAGRRTIFFPHTSTGGEYYVTSLTNADQVDFIGDNCSFVGGYTGTIQNMGAIAELSAEYAQQSGWVTDADLVDDESPYIINNPAGGVWINTNYNLADKLQFERLNVASNRHVGLSSVAYINNGEFNVMTREATKHPNDTSAKITLYKNKNGGKVFNQVPYLTVIDNPGVDDRDFSFAYMGSGRLGIISARSFADQPPVFSYSDDDGETWTNTTAMSTMPNNLACVFGIHKYPASVGGHDTDGYIAYGWTEGMLDGIYAVKTVDNGDTWTYQKVISDAASLPSEATVCRIGNGDKWLMVYRQNANVGLPMKVATSTDMINWTTPAEVGTLGKNPPYLYYKNGMVYLFASIRSSNEVLGAANKLIYWRTTPANVYAGDFSDFGDTNWKEIAKFENLLGYFSFAQDPTGDHLYGSVAYAEQTSSYFNGTESKLMLMTDEDLSIQDFTVRNTIIVDGSVTFHIHHDRMSGVIDIMFNATLTYLDATALSVTVTLPYTLDTIKYIGGNYKTMTTSTTGSNKLGGVRTEIVSDSQVKISLYTTPDGTFASGNTAIVGVLVKGELFL